MLDGDRTCRRAPVRGADLGLARRTRRVLAHAHGDRARPPLRGPHRAGHPLEDRRERGRPGAALQHPGARERRARRRADAPALERGAVGVRVGRRGGRTGAGRPDRLVLRLHDARREPCRLPRDQPRGRLRDRRGRRVGAAHQPLPARGAARAAEDGALRARFERSARARARAVVAGPARVACRTGAPAAFGAGAAAAHLRARHDEGVRRSLGDPRDDRLRPRCAHHPHLRRYARGVGVGGVAGAAV